MKKIIAIIWKTTLVVGAISIFGMVTSAAIDTWILSPDIPPTPEVELSLADKCAKATTYTDNEQIIEDRIKNLDEIKKYETEVKTRNNSMYVESFSDFYDDKNPLVYTNVGEKLPNNSQVLAYKYGGFCDDEELGAREDPRPANYSTIKEFIPYMFTYKVGDLEKVYSNENINVCREVFSKELPDLDGDGRPEIMAYCGREGNGVYRDIGIYSIQGSEGKVVTIGSITEGGSRGAVLKDMNNDGHLDLVSFLRSQDDDYQDGDKYNAQTCLLEKPIQIDDKNIFGISSMYVAYYEPDQKRFGEAKTLTACLLDFDEMKQFKSLVE